jgi:hypothetical protein
LDEFNGKTVIPTRGTSNTGLFTARGRFTEAMEMSTKEVLKTANSTDRAPWTTTMAKPIQASGKATYAMARVSRPGLTGVNTKAASLMESRTALGFSRARMGYNTKGTGRMG